MTQTSKVDDRRILSVVRRNSFITSTSVLALVMKFSAIFFFKI